MERIGQPVGLCGEVPGVMALASFYPLRLPASYLPFFVEFGMTRERFLDSKHHEYTLTVRAVARDQSLMHQAINKPRRAIARAARRYHPPRQGWESRICALFRLPEWGGKHAGPRDYFIEDMSSGSLILMPSLKYCPDPFCTILRLPH